MLRYDPELWHERFVLGHVEATEYLIMRPDHDIYVEQLDFENDELSGFRLTLGDGRLPFGVDGRRVHRLPAFAAGEKAQLLELTGLSLFNEAREKHQVCVEMLHRGSNLEEAYRLCSTIVNTFGLSKVEVLSAAGARIARESSFSNQDAKASEFLAFINPLMNNDEWDLVLRSMVNEYSKLDAAKPAEKLVTKMKGPKAKIDANIACNKLKAAYLVAVRAKLYEEIVRIHKLAVEGSNRGVVIICEAYLAKNKK